MTVIEDIVESIENRLCELNDEIGALTAARDALDGRGSRAPTRRRRGAATGQARTGPSNDAGGAGPLHGAVEPADPASTAAPSRAHAKVRKPARRSARANAGRSGEVVRAGTLELLLSDTGGLATSELADRVARIAIGFSACCGSWRWPGEFAERVSDARRGGTRSLTRSGSRNERRSSPHGATRRPDDSTPTGHPDWMLHSAFLD